MERSLIDQSKIECCHLIQSARSITLHIKFQNKTKELGETTENQL